MSTTFRRNRRAHMESAGLARKVIGTLTLATAIFASSVVAGEADEPGRGLTADFEVDYLQFIIDHHFSALRMTELAAGTQDRPPPSDISPDDKVPPTPGYAPTAAKAHAHELLSLARRNNRVQREEILAAQSFLSEWYGIDYEPGLTAEGQQAIDLLEEAPEGESFDVLFIRVFSRHHYVAAQESLDCLVASELEHEDLERFCRSIVNAQIADIDEMRTLLCEEYDICDYQPFEEVAGRDSGSP